MSLSTIQGISGRSQLYPKSCSIYIFIKPNPSLDDLFDLGDDALFIWSTGYTLCICGILLVVYFIITAKNRLNSTYLYTGATPVSNTLEKKNFFAL